MTRNQKSSAPRPATTVCALGTTLLSARASWLAGPAGRNTTLYCVIRKVLRSLKRVKMTRNILTSATLKQMTVQKLLLLLIQFLRMVQKSQK